MIKVLVVDDSPVVREFLVNILSSDPEIQVIGTANNGDEAFKTVKSKKPDVITMDINMPKMNGFDVTRRIMETMPTPIVIVSGSWDTKEVATTFRTMEAGALAIVQKPFGMRHPEYEAAASELVQTVKLMSEVKVVKRWPRPQREPVISKVLPLSEAELKQIKTNIKIVAIGASTGGPVVLQTILSMLPKDFPVPVLIVQHIAEGFIRGFVDWLGQKSDLPVHVAMDGKYILPGHVYVAPDRFQMGVGIGGRIILSKDKIENGLCPSVSYLFRSIANIYRKSAAGVLLTGMGKDGAEELKLLKEKGAITIVQNKESSVVYGMPGQAIKLGAATHVLSPASIPAMLISLVQKGHIIDTNKRGKKS
jgi:two-component system chemotaxis response regulator CheB